MITTIAVLIPLVVSFVLAVMLVAFKPTTRLEWIMAVWFSLAFSFFYFLTGAWFLLSMYVRYAIAVLVPIAVVVSILCFPKGIPFTDFADAKRKFTLASYAVPALIFSVLSVLAIQGLFYSGQPVSLTFPLKGGPFISPRPVEYRS